MLRVAVMLSGSAMLISTVDREDAEFLFVVSDPLCQVCRFVGSEAEHWIPTPQYPDCSTLECCVPPSGHLAR